MISSQSPLNAQLVKEGDKLASPCVCIQLKKSNKGYSDDPDLQGIRETFQKTKKPLQALNKETWNRFAEENLIRKVDADEYFANDTQWAAIVDKVGYITEVYMGRCVNASPKVPKVTKDAEDMVPKLVEGARGKWFRKQYGRFWIHIEQKTEIYINGEESKVKLKTSPTFWESFKDSDVMRAVYTWLIAFFGGIITLLSQGGLSNFPNIGRDYLIKGFFVIVVLYIVTSIIRWLTTRSKSSWELVNE